MNEYTMNNEYMREWMLNEYMSNWMNTWVNDRQQLTGEAGWYAEEMYRLSHKLHPSTTGQAVGEKANPPTQQGCHVCRGCQGLSQRWGQTHWRVAWTGPACSWFPPALACICTCLGVLACKQIEKVRTPGSEDGTREPRSPQSTHLQGLGSALPCLWGWGEV